MVPFVMVYGAGLLKSASDTSHDSFGLAGIKTNGS